MLSAQKLGLIKGLGSPEAVKHLDDERLTKDALVDRLWDMSAVLEESWSWASMIVDRRYGRTKTGPPWVI